jgi:hypothetical protein
MMPCAHDVGEAEKARNLLRGRLLRRGDESPVGVRHTHKLALCAVREAAEAVIRSPPAAVEAGGADTIEAVHTGHVTVVKWSDYEVADLDLRYFGTDLRDYPHELVTDSVRMLRGGHPTIGPEV